MKPKVFRPLIEQFGAEIQLESPLDVRRKDAAYAICKYLKNRDEEYLPGYYAAVKYLLQQPESERILLYLPFHELADAPASFQNAYMQAWWHLTNVQDVSENFHLGDTFEVDARPGGQLARVVKCGHLVPWLLKYNYLSEFRLLALFHDKSNVPLLQSIVDTIPYLEDHGIVSTHFSAQLKAYAMDITPRKKYLPIYTSEKRARWLEEMKQTHAQLATPDACLSGPFFPNLSKEWIDELSAEENEKDIILVGGSRLKGYGIINSDYDTWSMSELNSSDGMEVGNPNAAHIYFNTAWVVGSEIAHIDQVVKDVIWEYDDSAVRKQSLERMEFDLLLYRLLHKGLSRFTGIKTFATSSYLDMEGDCPFYDDYYRMIATMLFAKYVWIPHVRCEKKGD